MMHSIIIGYIFIQVYLIFLDVILKILIMRERDGTCEREVKYMGMILFQVIVQRTLASKTMIYAKSGCLMAAFLKFLPLWLLVFPGMASRVLFPDEVNVAIV